MDKYNNLLRHISDEYSISKGKSEKQEQWKARLIYSVLGRMALASLFDMDEDENSSIVHMKRRIETILFNYVQMYPEIGCYFPDNPQEVSNEIHDVYLHTGTIYHEPNRVLMATKSEATVNGITFIRGADIETKQNLSGLGTYMEVHQNISRGSLTEMFQLDATPLQSKWKQCVNRAKWSEFNIQANIEYLRMAPPYNRGYWIDKPDTRGKISILRTGFKGLKLYYLYKLESGKLFTSQLPQWQVEDYNYRLLTNACLCKEGTLPPSTYVEDGELIYIKFGYLPPPAELYLWKLYTWPVSIQAFPNDFNRICSKRVFNAIKDAVQQKGYIFTKE